MRTKALHATVLALDTFLSWSGKLTPTGQIEIVAHSLPGFVLLMKANQFNWHLALG